ncbi:uncharacterized protein STEHIDRAFT_67290 [Stereum hirsutum FP-91666 SS1]|uniref:uncharacterized protein n=1 Tax=Stereum hirsutum (strain FP-91666) TaxID=721885 RepID=UPI0004449B35|nr:uncharacterized protein STEHIDRAFT_67290 [Stereum hirsutum FP-91666 SS1]EIM81035.1 hypothetical protein STEHIDRAFT_67290 [Stereum hirsutum FP-91666 SS1]
MSTRQNKKRKNKVIRERTVTTLTGAEDVSDPSLHPPASASSFLGPQATEDQLVSSPFSVASSSGGNPSLPSAGFQMPTPFSSFGYNPNMPGMQLPYTPTHSQFFPDPSLPPGRSDLEVLERLKETIRRNEHEIFRPIPQPAALASVYKGPLTFPQSTVPPHPEQVPQNSFQSSSASFSRPGFDRPPQQQQQGTDKAPEGSSALSAAGSSGNLGRSRNDSISWESSGANSRGPNNPPNTSIAKAVDGKESANVCLVRTF